uniref:serine--tRNA ligase n=3 Tax=Rhodosorus marinus TaxID=101924 RepID=A0A7S2ZGZ4_9RHOD|mmetsp:Transcript_18731/g.75290  ORF Transcript_18731/g.75290 Transcript_18731/m.75290 type:complete len:449 (+) Transcript_18731:897-2243(+)
MLDINLFRVEKGGNPDLVRESQRRRFADEGVVDEIIRLDEGWRKSRFEQDSCRRELNKLSKEVGLKKRAREDASELIAQTVEVKKTIAEAEKITAELEQKRDALLRNLGNLVHESVPTSKNEDDNLVVRTWGEPALPNGPKKNHVDLLHMIDGVEYERGTSVAGNRGYFLKGFGVQLNLALIHYGLNFLVQRGYTPIQTPYFMEKEAMAKVAQLEQFDEELYTVGGLGVSEKYLIATSEQPIAAYHVDDWVDPRTLPRKYVGYSTCFRKEAGSHGRDTLGIFRVHQFEKIEQFCLTSPEDNESWNAHENMIKASEEFHQSLGIPYRVVSIVSGALNKAAAKKLDLEGWYPAGSAYRELVSCSNCTDYQSRRLQTRFGSNKRGDQGEKKFVHMLNSTLCATTRVICAILENNQTDEGVIIPEPLRAYMGGKELMEFSRAPPNLRDPSKK